MKILSNWEQESPHLYQIKWAFSPNSHQRQIMALCLDKGSGSPRWCNTCKYICTQHLLHEYLKQILIELAGETDSSTVMVGHFSTPLSILERSPRHKVSKATTHLINTRDQMDFIYIYIVSTQQHRNPCSSQVHMVQCPGEITHWATQLALTKVRRLKSQQVCFVILRYNTRNR